MSDTETLTEADKAWLRDQNRKNIMDARERALLAQQRVEDADEVGRELHGELFVAAMAYHSQLRPYRDEPVLDGTFPLMDTLGLYVGTTDEHIADMGTQVGPDRLSTYVDKLDRAAEKLGFTGGA
jgi:hypothetical protein